MPSEFCVNVPISVCLIREPEIRGRATVAYEGFDQFLQCSQQEENIPLMTTKL